MPNSQRLDLLRQYREQANLSQEDAARLLGLTGRQSRLTVGAWERGDYAPDERRRTKLIGYLWDHLRLRTDPARFEQVWEMLVEEWGWAALSDEEWRALRYTPSTTSSSRQGLATPAPFQAPPLARNFVGRHVDLTTLAAQLKSTPCLVALVGMGGIGKTTLATHLAHQLRHHFIDGVLWAPMASADPQDVLQLWAQALGYDLSTIGNLESKAAALRSIMSERSLLLVLDDVRQTEAARILLPNSPTCAVLTTTRDHDIARLLDADLYPIGQLALADSLVLLQQLVGARRLEAEQEAAVAICTVLDHFPLALEIVGKLLARTAWRPLAVMAQHLRDVTRRLDQLQIKDLSVRASFEVSWEMLDGSTQRLFTQLGLWRGRSFGLEALAQTSGLTLLDAEEQLSTLVALSLLNVEGLSRYRQHPLLADFAFERLQQPEAAVLRVATYYLAFCRRHQHDHLQLESEAENVIAAMHALYDLQQWQAVVEFASLLTEHWVTRARYDYARRGHNWAIHALEALSAQNQSARHWIAWGYACAEQGDFAEAETHITHGLEVAQQVGDLQHSGDAQYHLGRLAIERSEHEAADEYLTQCEETRRQTGDQLGLARALHLRGLLLYRTGDYRQSRQYCEAALAIQEQQDIAGQLGTLSLLTDNALMERDHVQAEAYCKRSIELATQYNYQGELAEGYFHYAAVCHRLEQFDRAWTYAEQARKLFERLGSRAWLAYTLYELSMIKRIIGENPTAISIGLESLSIMAELQDEYNRVMCMMHLGELYRRSGDTDEARRLWQAAETLAVQIHHPELLEVQENLRALQ
jgi:tetratricopeptide (TPR) repeat protein/transcriptional regulator with XRE-family HTH domain